MADFKISTSLFFSFTVMLFCFTFRDLPLTHIALDAIDHAYNNLVLNRNIRARYEVEKIRSANATTDEVFSEARISADASTRLVKMMLAHDKYPEAVCNDGSPAAFYHQFGLLNSRDWIVHLEVRCAQSRL